MVIKPRKLSVPPFSRNEEFDIDRSLLFPENSTPALKYSTLAFEIITAVFPVSKRNAIEPKKWIEFVIFIFFEPLKEKHISVWSNRMESANPSPDPLYLMPLPQFDTVTDDRIDPAVSNTTPLFGWPKIERFLISGPIP
jgi:hypothetical protein